MFACFDLNCGMFFHDTLDGSLILIEPNGTTPASDNHKHVTRAHEIVASVLFSFSVSDGCTLSVDLFPWVTIMKIESRFLPHNSSAVVTPHVLPRILFSSEPSALIRMIVTIRRRCVYSDCPSLSYL